MKELQEHYNFNVCLKNNKNLNKTLLNRSDMKKLMNRFNPNQPQLKI